MVSRTDPQGTTSYEYDARHQRTRETVPGAISTTYAYDAVGNLVATTTPDGTTIYAYDQVNLLSQLTDPGGGRTTYAYSDDNSRTRTGFPGGASETRSYDQAERVKTIKAIKPGGALIVDLAYDYMKGDRETDVVYKVVDGVRNTTTTFEYDHLGRLTAQRTSGADSELFTYNYDANSNRLYSTNENGATTSYSYNAANQMTTSDGTTYAYDANGNTTSSSDGWGFTYNAVNQTTSIQAPGRPNPEPIRFLGAGQSEMIERGGAPLPLLAARPGPQGHRGLRPRARRAVAQPDRGRIARVLPPRPPSGIGDRADRRRRKHGRQLPLRPVRRRSRHHRLTSQLAALRRRRVLRGA